MKYKHKYAYLGQCKIVIVWKLASIKNLKGHILKWIPTNRRWYGEMAHIHFSRKNDISR